MERTALIREQLCSGLDPRFTEIFVAFKDTIEIQLPSGDRNRRLEVRVRDTADLEIA